MPTTTQGESVQKTKDNIILQGIDATGLAHEGFGMLCGILSALIDKGTTDTQKQLAQAGWQLAFDYSNLLDCESTNFKNLQRGES